MKSRHRAREIALQILYQYDQPKKEPQPLPSGPKSFTSELHTHFEHFKVPEPLQEFISQLVLGTLREQTGLDQLIEQHAAHWKVARMSSVDRCLLRLAVYELTRMKDVPQAVVIDEAVELAKQFGTSETPAFVNGILDSVRNSIEAPTTS